MEVHLGISNEGEGEREGERETRVAHAPSPYSRGPSVKAAWCGRGRRWVKAKVGEGEGELGADFASL